MMAIIFFAAPAIERFTGYEGLTIPLRVLSPTIFVVAVAGTMRGFFQSRKTMIPTAVSQIVEQIFNAAVSIFAGFSLRFPRIPTVPEWGQPEERSEHWSVPLPDLLSLYFFLSHTDRVCMSISHMTGQHMMILRVR